MVNITTFESRPDMGTLSVRDVDMSPENSKEESPLRHKERPMRTATLGVLILLTIAPSMRAKDEKLKADQIIAKHLESIGPKEKLKNIKNRVSSGNAHVDIHVGGTANLTGNGMLVSEYRAVRLSFKYPANQYPGEQFVFDGKNTAIGQISPGVRSSLGNYIFENDYLLKDGLLFGTLSTNWLF